MALLIRTDGRKQRVALTEKDRLRQVQALVGGYIEIIPLRNGTSLVMDEEGKLKDRELNHFATLLFQDAHGCSDCVVGDVLLVSNKEIR